MKLVQQNSSRYFTLFAMLLVIAMHIPFLNADPDVNISVSRDAFTDEGLHMCQLRNYINYDQLKMDECDNLIKGPLLAGLNFITLKLFGIHKITTRLTTLIFTFLLLLIPWFKQDKYFSNLLITTVILTNYYVFNYSHYGLAEMLCTAFIFIGCYYLQLALNASVQNRIMKMVIANLFFAAAYYTKFLFVFTIAIPVAALVLDYLIIKDDYKSLHKKLLLASIGSSLLFLLLYLVFWIYPNYETFILLYKHQPAQLDISMPGIYRILEHSVGIFKTPAVAAGAITFAITFVIAILLYRNKVELTFRKSYLVIFCWLLCESPKLTMGYMPSRYMVSIYFAMLLMVTMVITYLIKEKLHSKYKVVITAFVVGLISINLFFYYRTLTQRKFVMSEVNTYLSHYNFKDKKIIGPWAPSLAWETKAYTYPVWFDFLNDKDILTKQKPTLIISEPDEEESLKAYRLNGIDLKANADSVIPFHIGSWDVNLYWMR